MRKHCASAPEPTSAHSSGILTPARITPRRSIRAGWLHRISTLLTVTPMVVGFAVNHARSQSTETAPSASTPIHTTSAPVDSLPDPKEIKGVSPLSRGETLLNEVQAAIVGLVRKVDPAVVTIQADRAPAGLGDREEWSQRAWISTGAGVIIRDDGMILTSQHVIDRASSIHVVLHDGRTVRAIPIAEDRRADLAIIRIQVGGLEPARLAEDDSVRRGNIVIALGNPLGLSGDGQAAVSHGIVSAIGRPLPENFGRDEDRYYGDMIQTTAPISPGNSGGPLIDIRGRIIGVITAVSTRSDGHEGIGFAVPINAHTRSIIERLMHGQPIEYGYIGVEVSPVGNDSKSPTNPKTAEGVLINSVFPGGPGERAGLRGGDIVIAVNNEPTRSVEQFVRTIGALGPQHVAGITYLRDSRERTTRVSLTRRPTTEPAPLPDIQISFRGAELGPLTQVTRLMANLPDNALLVRRVDADSPADRAGLTPGDILVRIDGQAISELSLAILQERSREILIGLANGGTLLIKPPPTPPAE